MTLSLVMPCCTLNKDLEEMAEWGLESYRPFVDELIVIEDGGFYSDKLKKLADVYVHWPVNRGFTKTVNHGWKLAKGDYVAIVNSDTDLLKGNLRDLCLENKVTSPAIMNVGAEHLVGCFFVVPKTIKEERGILDERYKMYLSDTDYERRILDVFQKVPEVVIWHENNATCKVVGEDMDHQRRIDQMEYNKNNNYE